MERDTVNHGKYFNTAKVNKASHRAAIVAIARKIMPRSCIYIYLFGDFFSEQLLNDDRNHKITFHWINKPTRYSGNKDSYVLNKLFMFSRFSGRNISGLSSRFSG